MSPRLRRAALVFLAVALAAGSLPAHGQIPDAVDLGASGVRIVGAPPYWMDAMPSRTRVEVTVTNHGAAPATYTLAWYWKEVGAYLNGTELSSTDAGRLEPGQSRVHGIPWTPQEAQEGSGAVLAVIDANDGSPADNTARLPLHVPAHRLSLGFVADDPTIRLGETRYLRLRATNLGTATEVLDLTAAAQGPGTSQLRPAVDPARVAIAPGQTAESILYVERPAEASDPPDTRFVVNLRNMSVPAWAPSALSPSFNASDSALPAGQFATALQAPGAPAPLSPGALFNLAYRLTNTGNASNSYRLSAVGPEGWGLAVDKARVALDATGSATVHLTGGVPIDAAPGSLHGVTLVASSERGSAGNAAAGVPLRVTGPVVLAPELILPDFTYQGEPVNVTLEVRNGGTQPSPPGTVTFSSGVELPGLPASFPAPAIEPGATLRIPYAFTPARSDPVVRLGSFAAIDRDNDTVADPDEDVYLAVRPDAASTGFAHPVGGGRVGASDVRINATGMPSGTRPIAEVNTGPYLRLPPPSCLDADRDGKCSASDLLYLDVAAPFGVASPGDIRLEANSGRVAGSRVLAQEPETGQSLFPAAANESLTFSDANGNGLFDGLEPAVLDLDLDGVAGPGDLRLTPLTDARSALLRPFGSRIAAGDRDNGSLVLPIATVRLDGFLGPLPLSATWVSGNATAASPASEIFVRTAALNVTSPAGFEASPGEALSLGVPPHAFQVRNEGNAPERISLRASSGSGTISLRGPDQLLLAPGESRIVAVNATLPGSLADGSVELRLEAWLEDHNRTRVQGISVVTLRDLTPPYAVFVDPPTVWSVARRLPVEVAAGDDVGVRLVNVTATPAEAGKAVALASLVAGEDGHWRGHLNLTAGNYTLLAEAIDSAGRRTLSAPATVQIAEVLPPRLLRLVPEDGDVVARGQDLLALFDDPAGLAGATLRIDGGEPFTVKPDDDNRTIRADLGNLTPGPHRIDLSVASRAGSFWNTTLEVVAHGQASVSPAAGRESPFLGASWALLALALLGLGRRRAP